MLAIAARGYSLKCRWKIRKTTDWAGGNFVNGTPPQTEPAFTIIKRRVSEAKGEYLFPHRRDKNEPMLKVNNAHSTALRIPR